MPDWITDIKVTYAHPHEIIRDWIDIYIQEADPDDIAVIPRRDSGRLLTRNTKTLLISTTGLQHQQRHLYTLNHRVLLER